MEGPPGILPARGNGTRLREGERFSQTPLARGVGVRGELEPLAARRLFEAFGCERQQPRARFLLAADRDVNRYATQVVGQRNAALSFSKKPSSGL
jgi:hypothetical protein